MVFGRSSAVNAFCRFPTFAVALQRRVGAVFGMAYVDDSITVEVVQGELSASKFLVGATMLLGAVFGEHKTRWLASQASCLGVHVRLDDVTSSRITFERAAGGLELVGEGAQARLTQNLCTSAQADVQVGRPLSLSHARRSMLWLP